MDKEIVESLLEVSNVYGLIIAVVISVLVFLYFIRSQVFDLLNRKRVKEEPLTDLMNHSIFYTIREVSFEINKLKFSTHGAYDKKKTECMRLIITTQLETIRTRLKTLLNECNSKKIDENELMSVFMKMSMDVVESYNSKAKEILTNPGRTYGIKPEEADLLINAYTKYRQKYHSNYNEQMVSVILNGKSYPTVFIKVSALLEIIGATLHPIDVYAEGAMNTVNGALMKYNK